MKYPLEKCVLTCNQRQAQIPLQQRGGAMSVTWPTLAVVVVGLTHNEISSDNICFLSSTTQ